MKNPKMFKFVLGHLKTKKMCKHAVKKLLYLLKYVPNRHKTQQMHDNDIPENGGTLKSVPYCYKNQERCNKAFHNYPCALEFVPESFMTQEVCDKAVNTYSSTIKFVPEDSKCIRPKKCAIKLLINVFLHFFIFLIDINLKKCVAVLFISDDPLSLRYVIEV